MTNPSPLTIVQSSPLSAEKPLTVVSSEPLEKPEGFLAGVWRNLNPAPMVKTAVDAVRAAADAAGGRATNSDAAVSLGETIHGLIKAQKDQLDKASELWAKGDHTEALGHILAGSIPIVGPAAAHAGEELGEGNFAGGSGEAAGLLAPFGVHAVAPHVAKIPGVQRAANFVSDVAPEAAKAAMKAGTAEALKHEPMRSLYGQVKAAQKAAQAVGDVLEQNRRLNQPATGVDIQPRPNPALFSKEPSPIQGPLNPMGPATEAPMSPESAAADVVPSIPPEQYLNVVRRAAGRPALPAPPIITPPPDGSYVRAVDAQYPEVSTPPPENAVIQPPSSVNPAPNSPSAPAGEPGRVLAPTARPIPIGPAYRMLSQALSEAGITAAQAEAMSPEQWASAGQSLSLPEPSPAIARQAVAALKMAEASGGAQPVPPPVPDAVVDPAALANNMREVPVAMRPTVADANYRAVATGEAAPNTAAPVYEAAARANKVTPVVEALFKEGIPADHAETMLSVPQWQQLFKQLGVQRPPSKLTIQEVLTQLRAKEAAGASGKGVIPDAPVSPAPTSKRTPGRQLTQDYLSDLVNFGGQMMTRGDMIAELQRRGGTPEQISMYLGGREQAAKLAPSPEVSTEAPKSVAVPFTAGARVRDTVAQRGEGTLVHPMETGTVGGDWMVQWDGDPGQDHYAWSSSLEPLKEPIPAGDAHQIQEIRNSIAEGELLLRGGKKTNGQRLNEGERGAIARAVAGSKDKLASLTGENPANVVEMPAPYKQGNPFARKALSAQAKYESLTAPDARDAAMAESFPVGPGYGRAGGGTRLEATIDRAVESESARKQAEHYGALAKAFDEGKVNSQGYPIDAESMSRISHRAELGNKRSDRIAKATAEVQGKQPWQVPASVYADSTGSLAGSGRKLVLYDHRGYVEKAIAEGKPVPPEVLADYPDLNPSK